MIQKEAQKSNMKKDYEAAEIEILLFQDIDIITSSRSDNDDPDTDWEGGQGKPW